MLKDYYSSIGQSLSQTIPRARQVFLDKLLYTFELASIKNSNMYLFELYFENACLNNQGRFKPSATQGRVNKWTVLTAHDYIGNLELLRLLALAGSGCTDYLHHLDFDLQSLLLEKNSSLQMEIIWQEHFARSRTVYEKSPGISALQITPEGKGKRLAKKHIQASLHYSWLPLSTWSPPAKHLLLAYGAGFKAHQVDEDLDFSDAFYQLKRIRSLFNAQARLTDPVAFLANLNYRGIRHRCYMPAQMLKDLLEKFSSYLGLNTSRWIEKAADYKSYWNNLSPELKTLLLPVIDAARHLHDALPSYANPLHFPGVMLLERPDLYCPQDYFQHWIKMLDQIFPAMQFVISLPTKAEYSLDSNLLSKTLPNFKQHQDKAQNRDKSRNSYHALSTKTILLLDIDSRLPNLALMKIAGYYRKKGYRIKLARKQAFYKGPEMVFASCVYNQPSSLQRIKELQAYYGSHMECGGSGIDLHKRLPEEIEQAEPDYDLYPELQDRRIGFLTRGCPYKCSFCIVPVKEGMPRRVQDVEALARRRDKLILLDDNILAYPGCEELLEEMVRRRIRVNFNQTLDLSLIDAEKACLLRSIQSCNLKFTRRVYHFSLNDNSNLDTLREKYQLLNFTSRDNVEFICMYGYNTTLAQDLERFKFLRSLPGAYVFAQEYKPISGGPEPQLDNFFDGPVDEYIDKLCSICFPQGMKSMEKYFRWLSKFYAKKFGKLHMGLVDTIFRYNKRYNRGRYIDSLAGTRNIL